MKNHFAILLVAAVFLPMLAAPGSLLAEPVPLVVYENDFTTRTGVEPIGGLTTGNYRPGELVSTRVGDTGQDSWVRRHGGKAATVLEHEGNRYVEFSDAGSNSGFVCQAIGTTVSEGPLRVSIDLLAPSSWAHATSPQSRVALGDRVLHSYDPPAERTILDHMASLFGFGAKEDTQTPVRFCAYNRAEDKLVLQTSDATVNGGHWYRFVADHDLDSNKYSVTIYDLGASQPELGGPLPAGPAATFSDLNFVGDAVDGISTVRLSAVNNGSAAGFDNIVMSAPAEGSPLPAAASEENVDTRTSSEPALATDDPPAAHLRIGWAAADITPEEPVLVAGSSRARVSTGVMDPITATALVLESVREGRPDEAVVMVSCDLLLIIGGLQDRVRELLKDSVPDIAPNRVVLNATHTHAAPGTYTFPDLGRKLGQLGLDVPVVWSAWGMDLGAMSPADYAEFAAGRIAQAIEQAWQRRKPGGVSFGLGHAVVGHNRLTSYYGGRSAMYGATDRPDFSHVEGYEDHSVGLLYTWDAERKLTGVVVNVASPSQASGGTRITADFWHDTRNELRNRLGEGLFVFPQCSAAGDQSPSVLVEKKAEARMERITGRNRRQQIAVRIADAVTSTLPFMEEHIDHAPVLAHRMERVELSRRLLTEEEAESKRRDFEQLLGEYRKLRQEIEDQPERKEKADWFGPITGVYWRLARASRLVDEFELQEAQPTVPVEVHVVRLGDMVLATNPFELYVDYGMQMKARSKAVQTFVVQLAGGTGRYLPTERSVAGGAYGAVPESTNVGPKGGRELVERTLELIASLWEEEEK